MLIRDSTQAVQKYIQYASSLPTSQLLPEKEDKKICKGNLKKYIYIY